MSSSKVALVLVLAAACAPAEEGAVDTGLDGLALTSVKPGTVVPGSVVVVEGRAFVDAAYGETQLRLRGSYGGGAVDVAIPARFVDYGRLEIAVDAAFMAAWPAASGTFQGEALVEVESSVDGAVHATASRALTLEVRASLTPRLDAVAVPQVMPVNQPIEVRGDGLLSGAEGRTVAVLEGCFRPNGAATCAAIARREVPVVAADPHDRTRGSFPFVPAVAGIQPGSFEGTLFLANQPAGAGAATSSATRPLVTAIIRPNVTALAPPAVSLGQYLDVTGGGFVGGAPGEQTTLAVKGRFTRRSGNAVELDLLLVPQFVSGPLVRYVLVEDDALGRAIDLRREAGTFEGTVAPLVAAGGASVTGDATPVSFRIAPVKQVIYVNFLPSYVESLRHFGLRALDARIRARVLAVARRDYATVNVELRETRPTDFALYAQVDIAGPDPNGQGLLGYDNTPGKDHDNLRLFDRIGGVNATTQEDGSAGYGGVFIESLFAFSKHPAGRARPIDGADAAFDAVFDGFRPDTGAPVVAADLGGGELPTVTGADCPAAGGDRRKAAACAVWTLGSLIGTTMTHEVGHSLGLANPDADGFHNFGDAPNRLMDAGGARPFKERAELHGQGPARFCDEEYAYLRRILPTEEAADSSARPGCF